MAFLATTFIPNEVKATGLIKTELPADTSAIKANLINRLEEIKTIDKSAMSFNEKQALRKEVRSIDKSLHDYGGVYISVGALLLIILLIIILF
jgi:hypothetical protein